MASGDFFAPQKATSLLETHVLIIKKYKYTRFQDFFSISNKKVGT